MSVLKIAHPTSQDFWTTEQVNTIIVTQLRLQEEVYSITICNIAVYSISRLSNLNYGFSRQIPNT
jgi:hypothetical protein